MSEPEGDPQTSRRQLEARLATLDLWLGKPNEFERLIDQERGRVFAFHVGKVSRGRVVNYHPPHQGFRSLTDVAEWLAGEEALASPRLDR